MALWEIAEVSRQLNCTQQNIHQKKDTLRKMGYLVKDPDDNNKEKITEQGFNYLRDIRIKTMKRQGRLMEDNIQDNERIENISNNANMQKDFVFDFMKKELEDLKKQLEKEREDKKYWQDLYIQQSEDFKRLAFPPLLDTQEGNKQTEDKIKKGFWSRFFK